ncbi:hypothetical protein ACWD46_36265 [Streptomyces sp. NPDC002486]
MDGTQGAEPARRLDPRLVLPVHYGDCTVRRSPLSALLAEADAIGLGDRVGPATTATASARRATPGRSRGVLKGGPGGVTRCTE